MLVLVDTNIVLRSMEPGHSQHEASTNAQRRMRKRGHTLCIVPQILYELWVVTTRPIESNGLGLTTTEADQELRQLSPPLFHFFLDERAIFARWRDLVVQHDVQGRLGHDARLVAAMKRHNVTHLLTFNDSDFTRFKDITVLTPDAVLAESM